MQYSKFTDNERHVTAEISEFRVENGISEYQLMIHITQTGLSFVKQLEAVWTCYKKISNEVSEGTTTVFRRFFFSDIANQYPLLSTQLSQDEITGSSFIEQPPLNGTKIALWVYLIKETGTGPITEQLNAAGIHEIRHGKYNHLWANTRLSLSGNSEEQMQTGLCRYIDLLKKHNCTLSDNCIRTWIFVRNVDYNYAGIVKARREIFEQNGLTKHTHFITSTGINGNPHEPEGLVMFDAYAIEGIQKEQIRHLYAKTHLNSTYEYGVTFERGTYVLYGDRRHVFISGTASINNKGEIEHVGDVKKQAGRMIENVETLLKEAGCGFEDVAQILVYLRDIADYQDIKKITDDRFPEIPKVIVLAAVCRPGWLIEMECIAVKKDKNELFEAF
ncbi:hypothetical protein LJC72_00815 [Bacteroides sp. OttesenSCG-928-D19]|nr:hypothetical protein [Bacteroides sp. OttesenSCG-928-D19]